jgi:hypothetical protein
MRKRPRPPISRLGVLALLAESSDGCTEVVLFERGFTPQLIAELVAGGLVTVRRERMLVLGAALLVPRLKITEAGRQPLERGG